MRTLIHLSDLHFGRVDDKLIAPLIEQVHSLRPDLVVVSGDLTQRARGREFSAARRFLDSLPKPQIVVPGNHDVPLYNVFDRFARPLKKYRRYIGEDLEPAYLDDEIAVLGLNTARSLTFKNGRVNERQIEGLRARLQAAGKHAVKIVVTHHPFDLPEQYGRSELVGRASAAMAMFASCGVDILLAGHMHTSNFLTTALRYASGGYSAVAVQAGSATSTRLRGEPNAFNIIRIASRKIMVQQFIHALPDEGFKPQHVQTFEQLGEKWLPLRENG